MQLEKLGRGIYDQHNQDYAHCEGLWEAIDTELAKKITASNRQTYQQSRPGDNGALLAWENVEKNLENGRVVELIMMMVRKQTSDAKCPLCGSSIPDGTAAMSRRDNETEICSVCGEREAFSDYMGYRE